MYLHGLNLNEPRTVVPYPTNPGRPKPQERIYVDLEPVANDIAALRRRSQELFSGYEIAKINHLLGGGRLYSPEGEMEMLELGSRVYGHGNDFPCLVPYTMNPDPPKVMGVIQ